MDDNDYDDDDDDEWAVDGMPAVGGNEVLGQNLSQIHLVHHKHMTETWNRT
jgi:hypothetical protein